MKLYHELAEHYFAIESHHRNIHDDVALIIHASRDSSGKNLIDVGCGSGEHCQELSRRGFSCTGIDISESMLQVARRRFPGAGTFLRANILEFTFFEEFDIAISLFGTLNYLLENDDITTAFRNISDSLKNGGTAVFEIWNSFPVSRIRQKKLSHISTTHSDAATIERFRGFTLIEESPRTIVEVKYRYIITDAMGTRELADQHIMRAFSRKEIETSISEIGLRIVHIFSSPRREPYQQTSNRMIVIANKA